MTIDWKKQETIDRLWASVIASTNDPINYNEVARIFGQGATYDSIEGKMRKFRKLAAELKEAASGRQGPTPTPARSRAKKENASPVKKAVFKGGRVTKNKVGAPKTKSKNEVLLGEEILSSDGDEEETMGKSIARDRMGSDEDGEFV